MIPLILSAVLSGTAVLAIMMTIGSFLSDERRIGTRMQTYLGSTPLIVEVPAHSSDVEKQSELAERLNRTLSSANFAERIKRDLVRANLPLTVPEYILLKLAAMLLPAAVVLLITRSLINIPIIALIGFFLPTLWVRQRQRRRSRLFEEQLPGTLATLISSLQAGFSLVQSLTNVAREAPEPTNAEIRRVVQEVQLGLSVSDALTNVAQRMESQDLELIVSVLKIHSRIGGNLTDVLQNISTTIRERTRLQREIRVITAQQRYASYVLALLPVILSLILMMINPEYMMKLFRPGWLLCIPFGCVILNIIGFFVIRRIVDIKI